MFGGGSVVAFEHHGVLQEFEVFSVDRQVFRADFVVFVFREIWAGDPFDWLVFSWPASRRRSGRFDPPVHRVVRGHVVRPSDTGRQDIQYQLYENDSVDETTATTTTSRTRFERGKRMIRISEHLDAMLNHRGWCASGHRNGICHSWQREVGDGVSKD